MVQREAGCAPPTFLCEVDAVTFTGGSGGGGGLTEADADLRYLRLIGGTLTGALTVPSIDFTGTLLTTQQNLGLGNVPHAAPTLSGSVLRFRSLSGIETDITLPSGGGGGTTTDRQRIETLSFTAVAATTTEERQQTLSGTPAGVTFGTGPIEMLTAVGAEDTFTILDAGVYLMEWNAVITANADRAEPCFQVLQNADDALLGETDPLYIREDSAGAYTVRRLGTLVVPADNTVSKAVVLNCRDDNSFSVAAAHTLSIIRGALGAMGLPGTPGGGGGGSGDDAFDWATVGNTDLVPVAKLPVGILTGIQDFTYIAASRAIVLNFDRIDGSTNNGQIILPDFLDATEVYDWAEEGDTSNVPNSKLPGNLVTAIDSFTYEPTSRILQLQLTRLSGGPVAGTVTLPEFLAQAAVEPWALTANPNLDIPSTKLPAHTVGLLPSFDPGSNVFSLARTTSVGSTVTTTTTFPAWAEESDLYDWVFTGNTDRLPYAKIPLHLRSLGTFGFDAATRVLTFNFQDTTPTQQTRTITLPDYLTAADVTSFDIHDGVADTAPVQDPDRFIFSNENVAGDPTQYTRADDLADYVLGKIAPIDIPDSIARDAEIEAWALVANASTLVPYAKLSNVVRSIGSLTYNTTSRALAINLQRSGGATEAVSATLPDWIEDGTISDWAETANTDTLPDAKIPSLATGKIIGLREYVEDRAANLIQSGDNLVWNYDDAANTLTGTVSTNTDDVTQIIRDVVNPLGPGLTESFNPSLNRLNIGLDIDTIIQVGSNMTKSVVAGVITLNATATGGAGINAEDAVDAVAAALTGGSKITVSYDDPNDEITISSSALNAAEVNDRIDTRLPTVTSFEASDENGIVRRIWTSARVGQRANISAQAHIVGVASPIDVADPTTNTDVFAASKRSVAQAIADNMGTGGMADGIVNSLDLSRSGRDLTVTLGRSIGADLTETVQLPVDENRFADSLGVLVTGQTLTVTIGRTAPLPDLVDTATLPTGGGGGTDTNSFVTGGAFTLSGQELSLQLTGNTGFTTIDIPGHHAPCRKRRRWRYCGSHPHRHDCLQQRSDCRFFDP